MQNTSMTMLYQMTPGCSSLEMGFFTAASLPFRRRKSERGNTTRTGIILTIIANERVIDKRPRPQIRAEATCFAVPERRFYAFDKLRQKILYTLGEMCAILHAVWEKTPGMIRAGSIWDCVLWHLHKKGKKQHRAGGAQEDGETGPDSARRVCRFLCAVFSLHLCGAGTVKTGCR